MYFDRRISTIFKIVSQKGTLTGKAQSCWGADTYTLNGVGVALMDDGYTQSVTWGDRLRVVHTIGRDIQYDYGNTEELDILYNGIIQQYGE